MVEVWNVLVLLSLIISNSFAVRNLLHVNQQVSIVIGIDLAGKDMFEIWNLDCVTCYVQEENRYMSDSDQFYEVQSVECEIEFSFSF